MPARSAGARNAVRNNAGLRNATRNNAEPAKKQDVATEEGVELKHLGHMPEVVERVLNEVCFFFLHICNRSMSATHAIPACAGL
jgi:hypothetical protein